MGRTRDARTALLRNDATALVVLVLLEDDVEDAAYDGADENRENPEATTVDNGRIPQDSMCEEIFGASALA